MVAPAGPEVWAVGCAGLPLVEKSWPKHYRAVSVGRTTAGRPDAMHAAGGARRKVFCWGVRT